MELGSECSLEASLYPGCGREGKLREAPWCCLVGLGECRSLHRDGKIRGQAGPGGSSPQHMDWVIFP